MTDQPANVVYSGPASGPDAPTTFRSLVNADLPASGVSANTYGSGTQIPVVTVNAKGVVTNVATSTVASVPNAVTFTSTGGAAPGATFDGSAAKTIDYSTVGAAPAGAYLTAVAVTAPVAGDGKAGTPINMAAATASADGYLTKGDWTTFNTKQPAGAYLTALTGDVTTVGSAASLVKWGAGNVIYVPLAGDIQTYITAATAGDTLILASGTYVVTSTITVGKSLTIKGQGSAATKVNSSTAAIAVFTIAASNVRLLDISSTNSGAGTAYTIFVNAGLTNLQIQNVIGILSGTGTKYGVWSLSSVTVSDSEFYPTSSDSNSNGVYLYNDSSATLNITANIQSVRVIATGVANNNRGIVGNNNNTAYTITINSVNNWLFCYGTTGTTDIALFTFSTATNNVTINDYQSILNGADYDVLNTSTNVLALNGSILSNGTISGTITRKYDMQASSSTVNGYLTSTDWSTFNGKVSGPAGATDNNVVLFNGATGKLIKDGGTLGTAAFAATTAFDAAGAAAAAAAAVTPTTLGLVIGTNVQAYDADLTTWAGITPGTSVGTALAVAVGTAGSIVVNGGALGTPSSGTLTNCTFPTLNQNTSGTAAGLSATLVIASGGTNGTATPTAGAITYGTGTAYAFTAAGTAGQILHSNGAGAPTWNGIDGGTF